MLMLNDCVAAGAWSAEWPLGRYICICLTWVHKRCVVLGVTAKADAASRYDFHQLIIVSGAENPLSGRHSKSKNRDSAAKLPGPERAWILDAVEEEHGHVDTDTRLRRQLWTPPGREPPISPRTCKPEFLARPGVAENS